MNRVYLSHPLIYCSLGKQLSDIALNYQQDNSNIVDFIIEQNNSTLSLPAFAIPGYDLTCSSRASQLLDDFLQELTNQFSLLLSTDKTTALMVATTCFDLPTMECEFADAAFSVERLNSLGQLSEIIKKQLPINGPCFTINTACSSSANAILEAKRLVANNSVDQVLLVSIEMLNKISVAGFDSLGLLSKTRTQPLTQCQGMNIGESLSAQLVSCTENNADFEVFGGACCIDTGNITTTDTEGLAFTQTVKNAFEDAGIGASQVDIIKTHGVGTASSDQAEIKAIQALDSSEVLPLIAFKPNIGHCLASAPLSELCLLSALKKTGVNAHVFESIEQLNNDKLSKAIGPEEIILSNHFAFGGNNNCLILKSM